jgi:asparagine synthase (glutamine-hydrolysing)
MCGIFGVLNIDLVKSLGDVFYAGNKVMSRGPDRSHVVYQLDAGDASRNFFLMFHRLSIMNTSPVYDQPFVAETRIIAKDEVVKQYYYVLCNGEIYNYKTLQAMYLNEKVGNDTDVIFKLFKEFQYDFKRLNKELNGEYALAIIRVEEDPKTQKQAVNKVWFSTDTSSVRPMFLIVDPKSGAIAFSSLLTGLSWLPYGMLDKKLVHRMDGGEMYEIVISKEGIKSEKKSYYKDDLNMVALTNPMTDEEELKMKIVNTLNACVERRLQTDRPLGCLLSGGLDSSLVAAIAARELETRGGKTPDGKFVPRGERLRTFSIGMTGGTDLYYARRVADHINSIHTEIIFTEEEGLSVIEDVIKTCESYDITTIRASVGQYLLARWISQNTDIKVLLNGDGADETQMGYIYYYMAPSDIEAHRDSMRLIDEIHLYDGLRVDRNVSRWGLEARVPYLDKNFVNLYKKIAPYLKRPVMERTGDGPLKVKRIEKYLLRKAYEEAYRSSVGVGNRCPILPEEVLWRPKETFSDALSRKEKSWYLTIQEWVDKNVTVIQGVSRGSLTPDGHFGTGRDEHCPPVSKESQWYREVFEREFGKDMVRVIPHYWLSSWSGSTEPAARSLKMYSAVNSTAPL